MATGIKQNVFSLHIYISLIRLAQIEAILPARKNRLSAVEVLETLCAQNDSENMTLWQKP